MAVLTLALGIGPSSAVFTAFDAVLLQLLPVENPRELVLLDIEGRPAPGMSTSDNHHTVYSYPQFLEYRKRSEALEDVAARAPMAGLLAEGSTGERVSGELVSGNFFSLLGVHAILGRLLEDEDDRLEGGHPVAVISHPFWIRRFGGAADAVGRLVHFNGREIRIIGVVEPAFPGIIRGNAPPDVYMTLAMRRQMLPQLYANSSVPESMIRHMNLIGRLKSGVTLQQASQAMTPVFQSIIEDELATLGNRIGDKEEFRNRKFHLVPALQGINNLGDEAEEPLLSASALVGLVLLISCINVAGLLMARSLSRSREMGLRAALGATRLALIRQALLESLLIALLGGAVGLVFALWTNQLLRGALGSSVELSLNLRVLAFNFSLALLTCPLFGLLPALQAAGSDMMIILKDQTAGGGTSRRQALLRKGAVVMQVAFSLCLLVASGLLAATLYNLENLDPGFRTDSLLSFTIDPILNGYDTPRGVALYEQLQPRLEQLPGVRSVGGAQLPLLGSSSMGSSLSVEGFKPAEGERIGTSRNIVTPGFFETAGIPLLQGREFSTRDDSGSTPVAIVNQAFVERYLSGRNPIGRRLAFSSGDAVVPGIEIVGVVANQKSASLREETRILTYTPAAQSSPLGPLTFYLLTNRREADLGPRVRQVVSELASDLPVFRMETIQAVRDRMLDLERSIAWLSAALAGIATLLSGVGLYGLVSYGVAQRRSEIGVRMALGARRRDLLGSVLKESVTYLGLGLLLGLPAALLVNRFLGSQLFGLSATDPAVYGAATLVLAASVFLAGLIPARRAASVDPVEALRG